MPDTKHEVKPSLRGVSHVIAAFIALVAGSWLALTAPTKAGAWASLAFTGTLLIQYCVSGLYHTQTWGPTSRTWLRRADHAAIFLLIAGTYTPICLLALHGDLGRKLLIMVWSGAGFGFLQSLFFVNLAKKFTALLYLALGWMAAQYGKEIATRTGYQWASLILGGGVLYSIGALAYVIKWPNPYPRTFGYHEIFHIFVILASATHFVAVAQLVYEFDGGKKIA